MSMKIEIINFFVTSLLRRMYSFTTLNQASYYQSHLDQVSRSFAFCIAQLKSPLKEWVGLSYLLFRNLDTIEDAKWQSKVDQKNAFDQFQNLFEHPETRKYWKLNLPDGLPASEVQLIQETPRLIQDFYELPLPVQEPIKKSLTTMLQGMQHFSQKEELRLQGLTQVNQYCFFVAGIVGELLTDLVLLVSPHSIKQKDLYFLAAQFGIFLQKINLLKDQLKDEKEKRFLVPDRNLVLASLKNEATGALKYLTSIPIEQKEFRLFCAWSLFLGLKSLQFIETSWLNKIFDKIPKALTATLLAQVESLIDDNQALIQYFNELTQSLKSKNATFTQEDGVSFSSNWLLQIYHGQLSNQELVSLGLITIMTPDQNFPQT